MAALEGAVLRVGDLGRGDVVRTPNLDLAQDLVGTPTRLSARCAHAEGSRRADQLQRLSIGGDEFRLDRFEARLLDRFQCEPDFLRKLRAWGHGRAVGRVPVEADLDLVSLGGELEYLICRATIGAVNEQAGAGRAHRYPQLAGHRFEIDRQRLLEIGLDRDLPRCGLVAGLEQFQAIGPFRSQRQRDGRSAAKFTVDGHACAGGRRGHAQPPRDALEFERVQRELLRGHQRKARPGRLVSGQVQGHDTVSREDLCRCRRAHARRFTVDVDFRAGRRCG